jgi:hypothetical protein
MIPLRTLSTVNMTLQFERKVLDSRLEGSVPRVLRFFSAIFGIRLAELQIDPQLESAIRPMARGLHSIQKAILRIAFSIWFLHQDDTSTVEDLREKHSGTLGNYSRRLRDYSKISWSTFQPWDDSSILEKFRLVELGDAQGLLAKAIKTTRRHLARLQSTRGLVNICNLIRSLYSNISFIPMVS